MAANLTRKWNVSDVMDKLSSDGGDMLNILLFLITESLTLKKMFNSFRDQSPANA